MSAGTSLQVLTASNLIHNEPVLWNSYLEATEDDKELALARIKSSIDKKHIEREDS